MNNSIISGVIEWKYPDGFRPMDSEELKKYFGTSANMSGIRHAERHIILSFAWNKVNMLLSILADQQSVLNRMEKKLRGNLKEFRKTSDIAMNVCGVKAKGFTFEYIAHDADIAQTGNIISFKFGKYFYIVQFAARKEDASEARKIWDDILASLTIKED